MLDKTHVGGSRFSSQHPNFRVASTCVAMRATPQKWPVRFTEKSRKTPSRRPCVSQAEPRRMLPCWVDAPGRRLLRRFGHQKGEKKRPGPDPLLQRLRDVPLGVGLDDKVPRIVGDRHVAVDVGQPGRAQASARAPLAFSPQTYQPPKLMQKHEKMEVAKAFRRRLLLGHVSCPFHSLPQMGWKV
jgi:hypothetical protein